MTAATGEQTIQWLGIRFAAPRDWQVVRHGLSPKRGSLILVDRYRQRLTLTWTHTDKQPDLDRLAEDYRARLLEKNSGACVEPMTGIARWAGVQRRLSRGRVAVTEAMRYDAATARLLEAQVVGDPDDRRDPEVLRGILSSIEAVEPIDAITRMRAFDLDVTVPKDWRLAAAEVKPAAVTLRFTELERGDAAHPTKQELIVRRRGMADAWWAGEHDDPMRLIGADAKGANLREQDPSLGGEHRTTRAVGVEAGPAAKRVLGLLRRREDAVWHDRRANAVFHVTLLSWPKREAGLDLFTIRDASPTLAERRPVHA